MEGNESEERDEQLAALKQSLSAAENRILKSQDGGRVLRLKIAAILGYAKLLLMRDSIDLDLLKGIGKSIEDESKESLQVLNDSIFPPE
ncbi:hypothetical protein KBI23_16810 [bacterium]|nr:hypothetical protein [bacterium]MBP9810142.1 hypothetical protein [bacterium]